MADDAQQDSTTDDAQAAATADRADTSTDLGDAGKKALAAERAAKKAAEKQLTELSRRLQEYEDRDKTEAQRLAERAEQAERERDDTRKELLRMRVVAETGLPAELHEFVVGDDEDSMRAKASKLMAQFGSEQRSVDIGQGPRSATPGLNEDDPLLRDLKNHLGIR